MSRHRLRHNAETGVTTWWEEADGGFLLHTEQDCEPILDANKRRANDGLTDLDGVGECEHVGTIPDIIVMKWLDDYGINILQGGEHLERAVKLMDSDPDWRFLRTGGGRLL